MIRWLSCFLILAAAFCLLPLIAHAQFDVALRDNGTPTFDVALASGAPPPAGKPVRPPIVIGVNGERPQGAESIGVIRHGSPQAAGARAPTGSVRLWPAVMRWFGKRLNFSPPRLTGGRSARSMVRRAPRPALGGSE